MLPIDNSYDIDWRWFFLEKFLSKQILKSISMSKDVISLNKGNANSPSNLLTDSICVNNFNHPNGQFVQTVK